MKKLINHTHYSKELMLEAYREFFKIKYRSRNLVSLGFAALLLFVCASALIDMARGLRSFHINHVIFIAIAFGLIWTVFRGYTSAARRTYDGMKQTGVSLDISYDFVDDGFEAHTEEDDFHIQWRQCLYSIPTENLCLIVVKKKYYAVDLKGFTEGSSEDFMELVRQKTRIRSIRAGKII